MNRGKAAAIKLRDEIGVDDPLDVPIEDVILAYGGYIKYEKMGAVDGRIVYGKKVSSIYINSEIEYEGRRRFALAHELGHLLMHYGSSVHDDNVSLDWFNNTEAQLKKGLQEFEANQFATEYLMPSDLFYSEAKGKAFNPELLRSLADRFEASLTSVAFKYFDIDLHPLAMFHIFKGNVKYWKKSTDLKVSIKGITKLPPPEDSVAKEYIDEDYRPIYRTGELVQPIDKSTWFELWKDEQDTEFFEYCIVTKSYQNILSIVWEP
jgi:Zn-dependent peptidase ImmA (M78 family)